MLSQVVRFGVMVRFGVVCVQLTGTLRPVLNSAGLLREVKWGGEAKRLNSGRFLFCSNQSFELDLGSNTESLEKLISLISRQACRKLCSSSPMLLTDGVASIATLEPDSVDGQS